MLDTGFENYTVFLYVFARMSGVFLFNPIFGRQNVPGSLKAGLALLCALAAAGIPDAQDPYFPGLPVFVLICVKELLIGWAVGFVINLFLSSALIAGELVDFQCGLTMARLYDPQSNASIPLVGSIFNLLFILLFLLEDGHLNFIRIMALSLRAIPPGPGFLAPALLQYLVMLFAEMLLMAVKIALPFIAVATIAEFGVGILMKTVPQISVFSINIQMRLLLGLGALLAMLPPIAHIMDFSVGYMFEKIGYALNLMA